MHLYFASQWILFFFLYSFMGWVWESCYVSLKERRLVNRGFMHGPFLPLYGSGAVIVLFCTMTVQDHVVLVFLLGMAGATALEFVTGVVMECRSPSGSIGGTYAARARGCRGRCGIDRGNSG